MHRGKVGLFGATSLVGQELVSLLQKDCFDVYALSRTSKSSESVNVVWHNLSVSPRSNFELIDSWLSAAPIWVLQEYFALLESCNARRIVVLSSTSRFTKVESPDGDEKAIAVRLKQGEEKFKIWAKNNGIEWVILRPTLIYGYGRDKNIAEIARFIQRFKFFPLLGRADGLRQPVHVEDVATVCIATLKSTALKNRSYNISGGEVLPYHEMVCRVFAALNIPPRFVTVPFVVFGCAMACMRLHPKFRHWSMAMVRRMNSDLVFDHADAVRDLNFSPRQFQLSSAVLPKTNSRCLFYR